MKGMVPVNHGQGLEKEADMMGRKAMQPIGLQIVTSRIDSNISPGLQQTKQRQVIQKTKDNYSVAEARKVLELTAKLKNSIRALNSLRYDAHKKTTSDIDEEAEEISQSDSLGRFRTIHYENQLAALLRTIDNHKPADSKAKPSEQNTSKHVTALLSQASKYLGKIKNQLAGHIRLAEAALPEKPQLAEDLQGPIIDNDSYGQERRAGREIEANHQVQIVGGPWDGSKHMLETVQNAWGRLPDEHVKNNPYLAELDYRPHGREGVPETATGQHLDKKMFIYPGLDDSNPDVAGTVIHETGHSVHMQNPELLRELTHSAGWEYHTITSARQLMFEDKLNRAKVTQILKSIRKEDNAWWAVQKAGNHIYRKAPDTDDYLWVRLSGTLPGDNDINSRRKQRDEWTKNARIGEENPHGHPWDYARTQPMEHFAELYMKMVKNPQAVYDEFVEDPNRAWEAAPPGTKEKAKLEKIKNSRLAQWQLFKTKVFKGTAVEGEKKTSLRQQATELERDGADQERIEEWKLETGRSKKLATPFQIDRLFMEIESMKPKTPAELEEMKRQRELYAQQQDARESEESSGEWEVNLSDDD